VDVGFGTETRRELEGADGEEVLYGVLVGLARGTSYSDSLHPTRIIIPRLVGLALCVAYVAILGISLMLSLSSILP
jgi:hypothetical protein